MENVPVSHGTVKSVVLSTAKLYHVTLNTSQAQNCSETKCYADKVFEFYGDRCQASVACQTLSGNPCGDYELTAVFPTKMASLCFEDELHSGNLTYDAKNGRSRRRLRGQYGNNQLRLDTWYSSKATFEASCYLWCTEDGYLPVKLPHDAPSGLDDTVLAAVSVTLLY